MVLVGVASEAHANDFSDFQAAREPYEAGNYAEAVVAFEALVGDVIRLTDANIIRESRKYLGAAYVFVDRRADAEAQFELIVREDEHQRMRAATYSAGVVEIFDAVRERVRREIQAEAEAEAERERLAREAELELLRADSERLERLLELARTESVERENSRWLAAVPFGVGQFQNENSTLGIVFAVAEAVLIGGAIATWVAWDNFDLPRLKPTTRTTRPSPIGSGPFVSPTRSSSRRLLQLSSPASSRRRSTSCLDG